MEVIVGQGLVRHQLLPSLGEGPIPADFAAENIDWIKFIWTPMKPKMSRFDPVMSSVQSNNGPLPRAEIVVLREEPNFKFEYEDISESEAETEEDEFADLPELLDVHGVAQQQ